MNKSYLLLVASVLLGACGGGSDSGTGDSGVETTLPSTKDTSAPTITAPSDLVVDADTQSGMTVSSQQIVDFVNSVTATDDSGTVTISHNIPQVIPFGTFEAVFTAADPSGNKATASVEIFVDEYHGTFLEPGSNWVAVCGLEGEVNNTNYGCELKKFSNYGYGRLTDYTVVNSDVLHVDERARQVELSSATEQQMFDLCPVDLFPIGRLVSSSDVSQNNTEVFSHSLSELSNSMTFERVNAVYRAQESSFDTMLANFSVWANNAPMSDIDAVDGVERVNLRYALPSSVIAWHSLKSHRELELHQLEAIQSFFEQWAQKIYVSQAYAIGSDTPTLLEQGNIGWLGDLGLMMLGVTENNDDYFRRGIARYFMILDKQVRADGSIVFESQRGDSALGYSTSALASVIMMAEVAAMQGYDLYSVEIDGKSIETMIDFNLRAYSDNELYHQYTQYQNPFFASPEQIKNWNNQTYENFDLETNQFLLSALEAYKRRFPNSELTALAKSMFPESEYVRFVETSNGGIHTCDYRKL
ncbi:alginate lyase family protein [Pseudoalteromonas byunsanensis]|uniref:Alginate lyase domain-containing protein n=1 Tax=Pseudoalteromonas byunsanensis TaxID=327939 RepID=A0A1S1N0A9_9GAMM|nr:alginate lyase family protein [Pseudoalteromonas byunsanensis]OHU93439.1 hypothetical protein BIW53_18945 [Pseudoalteromonas byunsanensis]